MAEKGEVEGNPEGVSAYPLTPGLLASIAMRANHMMFMPTGPENGIMSIGRWNARIPDGLRAARKAYRLVICDKLVDGPTLEEVEGRGFYSPDREDHYRSILAAFPGMLQVAQDLVSAP